MQRVMLSIFLYLFYLVSLSAAADTTDWQRFEWVLTIEESTLEQQALSITEPYDEERDKAAAIFYWITHNVAYDTKQYRQVANNISKAKSYSPEEIEQLYEQRIEKAWKKRKGVCENYARLFERMADIAGLEAHMVTGYARGDYLRPAGFRFGHAWNAIRIDGEWSLLDATWGAGSVNDRLQFNYRFKPSYFLANPGGLIISHFPKEEEWQMLAKPISAEEWRELPAVGDGLLRYGVIPDPALTYLLRHPRKRPLIISGRAASVPRQFVAVNLTTRSQLPANWAWDGENWSLAIGPEHLQTMKLGIVTPESDLVLAFDLVVP